MLNMSHFVDADDSTRFRCGIGVCRHVDRDDTQATVRRPNTQMQTPPMLDMQSLDVGAVPILDQHVPSTQHAAVPG